MSAPRHNLRGLRRAACWQGILFRHSEGNHQSRKLSRSSCAAAGAACVRVTACRWRTRPPRRARRVPGGHRAAARGVEARARRSCPRSRDCGSSTCGSRRMPASACPAIYCFRTPRHSRAGVPWSSRCTARAAARKTGRSPKSCSRRPAPDSLAWPSTGVSTASAPGGQRRGRVQRGHRARVQHRAGPPVLLRHDLGRDAPHRLSRDAQGRATQRASGSPAFRRAASRPISPPPPIRAWPRRCLHRRAEFHVGAWTTDSGALASTIQTPSMPTAISAASRSRPAIRTRISRPILSRVAPGHRR